MLLLWEREAFRVTTWHPEKFQGPPIPMEPVYPLKNETIDKTCVYIYIHIYDTGAGCPPPPPPHSQRSPLPPCGVLVGWF